MKRIAWGAMPARFFASLLDAHRAGTVYYFAFGNVVIAWRRKP